MSKANITIGIILLLTILTSCKEKPKSLDEQFSDKDKFHLKAKNISVINKRYGNPHGLKLMDSLLFYKDNFNKKHFSVIDVKNKKMLRRFGKEGKGPNEVPMTTTLRINRDKEQVEFTTLNTDEFFSIPIAEIIGNHKDLIDNHKKFEYPSEKKEMKLNHISSFNNKYISSGFINDGKYAILNKKGKVDTIVGNYWVSEKHSDLNGYQKANAYQGSFSKHPSKPKIVYYGSERDFLEILSVSDNKFKFQRRLNSYFPEIEIIDNRIALKRKSPLGFFDTAPTSKFIYALFSGKNYKDDGRNAVQAKKVFVFDWNLNPVCSYVLEYGTMSIAVSENNEEMYAFGITEDNEVELLKYELKH